MSDISLSLHASHARHQPRTVIATGHPARSHASYGLTPDQAYPLLAEWNQRCDPPWSEKELRHKLEQADRQPGDRGFLLAAGRDSSLSAEPSPQPQRRHPGASKKYVGDKPNNPHRLAAEFLADEGLLPTWLRYWREEHYLWDGTAYRLLPEKELKSKIAAFARSQFVELHKLLVIAHAASAKEGEEPPATIDVNTPLVNNVIQALNGMCLVSAAVETPAWIDGAIGPDPQSILAAPNGLLDLDAAIAGHSAALLPSNPDFFATTGVNYEIDLQGMALPDCGSPSG